MLLVRTDKRCLGHLLAAYSYCYQFQLKWNAKNNQSEHQLLKEKGCKMGNDYALSLSSDEERRKLASLLYFLFPNRQLNINGGVVECVSEQAIMNELDGLKRIALRTPVWAEDTAFMLDSDQCIQSGLVKYVKDVQGEFTVKPDDDDVQFAIQFMHQHFKPSGETALTTKQYPSQKPKTYEQTLEMLFVVSTQTDYFRILPLKRRDGSFVIYACGVPMGTKLQEPRYGCVRFDATEVNSLSFNVAFDIERGLESRHDIKSKLVDMFIEQWNKVPKSERSGDTIKRLLMDCVAKQ